MAAPMAMHLAYSAQTVRFAGFVKQSLISLQLLSCRNFKLSGMNQIRHLGDGRRQMHEKQARVTGQSYKKFNRYKKKGKKTKKADLYSSTNIMPDNLEYGQSEYSVEEKPKKEFFLPDVYQSEEMKNMQEQAKRSVLIVTKAPLVREKAIKECEKWGPIHKVIQYKEHECVLVVFKEEDSFTNFTQDCSQGKTADSSFVCMENRTYMYTTRMRQGEEKSTARRQYIYGSVVLDFNLDGYDGLNDLWLKCHRSMAAAREASLCQYFIYQCIQDLVQKHMPDYEITPFGSTLNGFGTHASDVDLCFNHKRDEAFQDEDYRKKMVKLKNLIKKNLKSFSGVTVIRARVPIIQCKHTIFGMDVDISFFNRFGIKAAQYMRGVCSLDDRIPLLAPVIKLWAYTHMSEFPQKFVFTALLIFFLQQKGIVPPFNQIKITNNSILPVKQFQLQQDYLKAYLKVHLLLVEFFQYYSAFDFASDGISLSTGKILKRHVDSYSAAMFIENPFTDNMFNNNTSGSVRQFHVIEMQTKMLTTYKTLNSLSY